LTLVIVQPSLESSFVISSLLALTEAATTSAGAIISSSSLITMVSSNDGRSIATTLSREETRYS